jgi:hypothetical protein
MPGRYDIEAMLIEQGKSLVRIESNQEHQSRELEQLSDTIKEVSTIQANCPARIQSTAKEVTARIQPPVRPSIGPLPLPKRAELIKLLPWAIAAGLGIASAMGWIPSVGTP